MKNEIWNFLFLIKFFSKSLFQKKTNFDKKKNNAFATMRHGCNGIFPFKTLTDGCKEVILIEFAHKYGISDTLYLKVSQTNMEFIGNSIKITSLQHHSWLQRESILCKHHSWLQSRNYKKKNRWTSKNLDLFMNLVN